MSSKIKIQIRTKSDLPLWANRSVYRVFEGMAPEHLLQELTRRLDIREFVDSQRMPVLGSEGGSGQSLHMRNLEKIWSGSPVLSTQDMLAAIDENGEEDNETCAISLNLAELCSLANDAIALGYMKFHNGKLYIPDPEVNMMDLGRNGIDLQFNEDLENDCSMVSVSKFAEADPLATRVPICLNLDECSDVAILADLKQQLPKLRQEYECPEESRDQWPPSGFKNHGPAIFDKIHRYNVFLIMDILSWATFKKFKVSSEVLNRAAFSDNDPWASAERVRQTILPFINSLATDGTILRLSHDITTKSVEF
ncbi:DUF6387 family protein [Ferrimonas sp. YFM]|uniref:DUF6387 family protein n=1 Tax=Ferrimonas sp. YFM TaxID=3028878 RepID=UPI002572332B|nr:DUF6387 family protein [Ferrimonas sp. YFM]BDY03815.1 hypothetical protein F0521_08560 [Ferrimonas sp. YFM]